MAALSTAAAPEGAAVGAKRAKLRRGRAIMVEKRGVKTGEHGDFGGRAP